MMKYRSPNDSVSSFSTFTTVETSSSATSYSHGSTGSDRPRSNLESFIEWDEDAPFPDSASKHRRSVDFDSFEDEGFCASFPETPWPDDDQEHTSSHDDAASYACSISIDDSTNNALQKLKEAREKRSGRMLSCTESNPSPSIGESTDNVLQKLKEARSARRLSVTPEDCVTPASPGPFASPEQRKSRWSDSVSPAKQSATPKVTVRRLAAPLSEDECPHSAKIKTPTDATKKRMRLKLKASDLAAMGLSPSALKAPDDKVKAALQKWMEEKGADAATEVKDDDKSVYSTQSSHSHHSRRGRRSSVGGSSITDRVKARSKSRQRRGSMGGKSSNTQEEVSKESESHETSERSRTRSSSRHSGGDSRRRRSLTCLQDPKQPEIASPRSHSRPNHSCSRGAVSSSHGGDGAAQASKDSPKKDSPTKDSQKRDSPKRAEKPKDGSTRSRSRSVRASRRVGSRSKSRTPKAASNRTSEEAPRVVEDVLRDAGISPEQLAKLQASGLKISVAS